MSIGLKSDSSGTSGSIVINGSDAVLVTPTGITTASIQDSSITTAKIADVNITTAKIADGNITYGKLSTSGTEADNVASRTAKAWIYYNGGTNNILADFNVSTVTDVGTGNFTVNFSSSLASSSISVSGIGRFDGNAQVICLRSAGTGSVGLYTGSAHAYGSNSGQVTDVDYVSISVFSI